MRLQPFVAVALVVIVTAAAGRPSMEDPACAAQMTFGLKEIDWSQPGNLAGTYDMVLVDSVPLRTASIYRRLRLILSLPDSSLSRTFPPISLVAAIETAETRQHSRAWQQPWPRSGLAGRALILGRWASRMGSERPYTRFVSRPADSAGAGFT